MRLYRISALRDVAITFTQLDPLTAPKVSSDQLRTAEDVANATERFSTSERTELLTKDSLPLQNVITIVCVSAAHQPQTKIQSGDFPLPLEVGDSVKGVDMILIERIH
jgi:hypothetical protein